MKVKLNTSRAGHRFDSNGRFTGVYSQQVGEVVDLPEDEAKRVIEAGQGSPVTTEQKRG